MKSAARIYFERRRRVAFSTWLAEHIVLPCVCAFAAGVLITLDFAEPAADLACQPADMMAHHQQFADEVAK